MQQNNNGLPRTVRFIISSPLFFFFWGGGIQYNGVHYTEATLAAPVTPQRMDNLVGGKAKEEKEEKARKTISLSSPLFSRPVATKTQGGKGSLFCPPLFSLPPPSPASAEEILQRGEKEREEGSAKRRRRRYLKSAEGMGKKKCKWEGEAIENNFSCYKHVFVSMIVFEFGKSTISKENGFSFSRNRLPFLLLPSLTLHSLLLLSPLSLFSCANCGPFGCDGREAEEEEEEDRTLPFPPLAAPPACHIFSTLLLLAP